MKLTIRAFCAAAMYLFAAIPAFAQNAQIPNAEQCFSATTGINGMVGVLGTITGGSGGAAGTYANVALTGGSGTGATANITVSSGGAVTGVAIVDPGVNYVVGDALSASSASIGNVSGFSVSVNSISINSSLAGGSVGMYVPGTLNAKQTYQDAAGTILNSNPITLDGNGCAIMYGSGSYRQILYDRLGNEVWDKLTSVAPVNPYYAGVAGGTANAITVTDGSFSGADGQIIQFIAPYTNTGAATLNPSSFSAIPIVKNTNSGPVPLVGGEIVGGTPGNLITVTYSATYGEFFLSSYPTVPTVAPPVFQGRLTLVAGSPVMATTVTDAPAVYYAPYVGNLVAIYNGTSVANYQFTASNSDTTGQVLSLGASSWPANTIFDVFDTLVNGKSTLCSVQWASSSARATSLVNYAGLLTNSASTPCYTANSIWITLPIYQGTYLGSFYTNSSAGLVDFNLGGSGSGGVAGSLGVFNAYNRVGVLASTEDTSSPYTYSSTSVREANASTGNQVEFLLGLADESVSSTYGVGFQLIASAAARVDAGIGMDAKIFTAPLMIFTGISSGQTFVTTTVGYAPIIGSHTIFALESSDGNANDFNEYGLNMLLVSLRM